MYPVIILNNVSVRYRAPEEVNQGTTTLLVTHDSGTVETLCLRAVWLDHGQIRAMGPSEEIVALYRQSQ